MKADLRKAIT